MRPNTRVSSIAPSQTLALDARAKALSAAGRDIVNLSVGQPDFEAPQAVRERAHAAIEGGDVRYTQAAGRLSLRRAIARHLSETRQVTFEPEEIAVCHSAKHALSGALMTLLEAGDEVLMPLPAWGSYFEQVRFAGGLSVGVPPRADMGPDLPGLEAAVTKRTRGVLLNSPSNPSGYVQTRDEVEALAAFAESHGLWILSDEIYSRMIYEGEAYASPVQVSAATRARTLIVDGASKTFAMTGYRIGYVAAPKEIAGAIARLHSQLTGSPNAISQDAFEIALTREPDEVAGMVAEFGRRREYLLDALAELGLETPRPRGAFYALPRVEDWQDERGCDGFCEDLLEEEGVALVPGTAFGLEGYARISYASSMEELREGVARLGRFLNARTKLAAGVGR